MSSWCYESNVKFCFPSLNKLEQREADEFEINEEEQDNFCKKKIIRGKCFVDTLQLPIVRVSK